MLTFHIHIPYHIPHSHSTFTFAFAFAFAFAGYGKNEDGARIAAACVTTPFVSFASHPADTLKTCLQGDVAQAR